MTKEIISKRRIATALSVAAGTLGLAGCTDYHKSSGEGMHLDSTGVLYVPGQSEGHYSTFKCDQTVLVSHLEQSQAFDKTELVVNDAACLDSKLTPEDFAVSAHHK